MCACGPAALGGWGTKKPPRPLQGPGFHPLPPNSQRWRLGLSLKPKHLSYHMEKVNCPANGCSIPYSSLRPLEEEPSSRCANTPAKNFRFSNLSQPRSQKSGSLPAWK